MEKVKESNFKYTESLRESFYNSFQQKKFDEEIDKYNEYFLPDNLIHRLLDLEKNNVNNAVPALLNLYFKKIKKYYKKIWHGEDLTDKTIFIFCYQCGYGDYMMYARYIPILEKMAKKVILEVGPNLYYFYAYNFPKCELVEYSEYEEFKGEYDYTYHHELFLNFQKDLEIFPEPEGYLRADPVIVKEFDNVFDTNKLKVGIFHEGTKNMNFNKYYDIKKMIPLFENRQCQFYSLNDAWAQFYAKEVHQKYNVIELKPYIHDIIDTASLMMHLDLVISVDSFPVHLAGALGIKTYLLLTKIADWRWFNDYYKTAWYDSVRIIRETPYTTAEDSVNELCKCLEQDCMEFLSKQKP